MGKIYRGTSGAQYQIEEQRLAGGGEGSVFGIQGQPQFVAKIYKENRRTIFPFCWFFYVLILNYLPFLFTSCIFIARTLVDRPNNVMNPSASWWS